MKQAYFTPDTIEYKAREMLQHVESIRTRKRLLLPSALLVLDMQRYFLVETSHAFVPSGPAIVPNIRTLIESYSQRGFPIIFTRHVNNTHNAAMMASWWHDIIDTADPLSQITKAIDTSGGPVIEKHQYDAFYGTQLETWLKEKAVTQVVICGVMTHLCCETTARSAFVRGFHVFFTVDGTATYNENFHIASLTNLSHGFATPVLVKEVLAAFGDQVNG